MESYRTSGISPFLIGQYFQEKNNPMDEDNSQDIHNASVKHKQEPTIHYYDKELELFEIT